MTIGVQQWPELKTVRERLGMSQEELATLLGVSVETIRRCEAGWQYLTSDLEKMMLLLLITNRRGAQLQQMACWEARNCSTAVRERCLAYLTGQGHLCWLLTSHRCRKEACRDWDAQKATCCQCPFFEQLTCDPDLGPTLH